MPAIWRTSVAVMGRKAGEAGKKTVWMSGRHRGIHGRHLDFVIEVGAVPQAADDQRGPMPSGRLDRQIVEGDDAKARPAASTTGAQTA